MKTLLAIFAALLIGIIGGLASRPACAQESQPGTLPALVQACNAGETITVDDGFPWATIMCGYMGTSANPHMHYRPSIRFNAAECQPWVIVYNGDGTAMIYCHRVLG